MTVADHDPMAYDEADDPAGDNLPGHIVNPDAWQARPSAGAMVSGGALFAVVVLCGVVLIAWATGWMADEVTRVLP